MSRKLVHVHPALPSPQSEGRDRHRAGSGGTQLRQKIPQNVCAHTWNTLLEVASVRALSPTLELTADATASHLQNRMPFNGLRSQIANGSSAAGSVDWRSHHERITI
jgi:hypothetical protein